MAANRLLILLRPKARAVLSVRGIVLNTADRQPVADATLFVTGDSPDSLLVASTATNRGQI